MTDLEYIKKFSKITIKKVCKDNNVSSSNLWAGRLKPVVIHKIRKGIEAELGNIYIEDYKNE